MENKCVFFFIEAEQNMAKKRQQFILLICTPSCPAVPAISSGPEGKCGPCEVITVKFERKIYLSMKIMMRSNEIACPE